MAQQILNVSTPNSGLGDALRDASIKSNDNFTELYNGKVDKVTGKDLSDNNLTNALVTKINDLEALAQVNVQSDWNENDIDADAFIKNKPTQVFASLGYFDYNDLATQTTPISVPSNTQTLLTNDALGANTDETQPPFAVTSVWNAGTANFFDFQQLSIGDTVDIRIHLKTTTSANNQLYHIDMKAGIGSASEFENRIFSAYVKSSAVDEQTFVTTFYVGNADIRDYPTQLFITSVGNTATVEVVGWFVRVFRKSVNIVDIVVAEEAPIDGLIYGRKDAAWFEVTGGGGSQTLAETLVLGNTTGGENIEISDGDGVFMDNGSRLIKGVTDAGRGGAKGIALKCSIDYEYKWEAGVLYVLQQDGFTIRETKYNFTTTPTGTDDSTKGFVIGSRWILDNGDVYECTDATTASADWVLQTDDVVSVNGQTGVIVLDTADISEATDKNYVSDAELVVIGNTSGTNTGDQNLSTLQPYAVATFVAEITFDVPKIFFNFAAPTTATLTSNLTGAKKGVVQKIYVNHATNPVTGLSGWVLIGSGTYTPSVPNIIFAEWTDGARVEYWIVKA
jgi:hypothetical protein